MFEVHEINEAAVEALMEADLVIRQEMQWKRRDNETRLRLRLNVANRLGEPVILHMSIPPRIPWQYSLALVWKRPVRRLDMRGSHVNQCDGSNRRWQNETHKHKWRDQYRDGWAYTPDDIPLTPGTALLDGEYQRVFEAFCRESNVELESHWVEPDLDVPYQNTMGST